MSVTRPTAKRTVRPADVMPLFIWEGTDKRGIKMKGEQLSKTANLLKAELRKQGITPTIVKPKPKSLFGSAGKRVTPRDIAIFSRQLATMLKSGVPIVSGLEIIAGGQKNPKMKTLVNELRMEIEGGSSVSEALAKHPKPHPGTSPECSAGLRQLRGDLSHSTGLQLWGRWASAPAGRCVGLGCARPDSPLRVGHHTARSTGVGFDDHGGRSNGARSVRPGRFGQGHRPVDGFAGHRDLDAGLVGCSMDGRRTRPPSDRWPVFRCIERRVRVGAPFMTSAR